MKIGENLVDIVHDSALGTFLMENFFKALIMRTRALVGIAKGLNVSFTHSGEIFI